jgi:hypothetical protein
VYGDSHKRSGNKSASDASDETGIGNEESDFESHSYLDDDRPAEDIQDVHSISIRSGI